MPCAVSYFEGFVVFFVIFQNLNFLTDLKHEQIYDRLVDDCVFAWMGQESCLVLSIKLIHFGTENSVSVSTLGL